MDDRTIVNENDLKAVNGGMGLTDKQWKTFSDKADALAQTGALSASDKAALDLIISTKDHATLLPLLFMKMKLGGAWAELLQLYMTF